MKGYSTFSKGPELEPYPPDGLASYLGHSLVGGLLYRDAVGVFYSPSWLGYILKKINVSFIIHFCLSLTLWIQPWPMRLVLPGNFHRHSVPRLCLPIWDNYYHSPRCVFWSEWQCSSNLRSFPILAGIHAEIKSLLGERLYLSRFTKCIKRRKTMLSNFSKLLFLSTMYVFTKCNKEKRKRSYETCSFVRKCDRSNRCKGGNYRPWLS